MLAWRRGFYGYMIAAVAFVAFVLVGGSYYALSVLTPVMAEDLSWSATQFGAVFSIFALLTGIASPLVGAFVARFGPRLAILIGSGLAAVGVGLFSVLTEIWHFYLFVAVYAFGFALGAVLPLQQLIGNWFIARRSLFLGLVMTGAGVGGLLMSTLASRLVIALGSWRSTWLILCGMLAIVIPLVLLFIRNKPEELGQRPDGVAQGVDLEASAAAARQTSRVYRTGIHWEAKAALKTPAFWQIALGLGVMFFLLQAVMAHQVAYLTLEAGVALSVAGSAIGLITTSSIIGRLAAGWLGDRIEPRIVLAGLLLMLGLSLALLLIGQGLVTLYLYVILFGIGYGGVIVLAPAISLNYFGSRHFAVIMGIATPIGSILGTVSPLLVGAIKDAIGSYVPAFLGMVVLAVVGAVMVFLALPPVPKAVETQP